MRILFVAMPDSPHVGRWIRLLEGAPWTPYLLPTYVGDAHPTMGPVTTRTLGAASRGGVPGVQVLSPLAPPAGRPAERLLNRATRQRWRAAFLARAVRRLRPDIVHALEFQGAAYLTLDAYRRLPAGAPPWIATNWGSDLFHFSSQAGHRGRIEAVLRSADYYSAECERDVVLAQRHGMTARALPVVPNSGGFDLVAARRLRQEGPTSARRTIAVKGYQHFAGRALTALDAVERCADLLGDHRVRVFSASPEVRVAAERLRDRRGLDVACLDERTPHDDLLRLHGRSRVSLGVSTSDGISTSLLEAMVMGSFPVQTSTACADEWIEDGVSGAIVPPDDPALIADRLRRALLDDALVDGAAVRNARTADARLDRSVVRDTVLGYYERIVRDSGRGRR